MLTLNQIIAELTTIQENHAQLNSFFFGDPYEMGASESMTYPLLGIALLPGSISKGVNTTKFLLYVADLVNKDESNENEVLSDMQLVALDVYADFWEYLENNSIELARDAAFSSFTERWDDEVSGWQMEIEVRQFYSKDTCQIPTKDPDIAPPLTPYVSTSYYLANQGAEINLPINDETDLFYFIGEEFDNNSGNLVVTVDSPLEIWNGSQWLDSNDTLLIPYNDGKIVTDSIYKCRITGATPFCFLRVNVTGLVEFTQLFATI